MKTMMSGKEVELVTRKNGSVVVNGRVIGSVRKETGADGLQCGYSAYYEVERIYEPGATWGKRADAVAAIVMLEEERVAARKAEHEREMAREALVVLSVLNVIAAADLAAELPMTEWTRKTFERKLADAGRSVGMSINYELTAESSGGSRETVTLGVRFACLGRETDVANLNWSGTTRSLEDTRRAISLYQTALTLAERCQRAADDARTALSEDRCPVHGDAFSDDGTCQSCYQDLLASEVRSG